MAQHLLKLNHKDLKALPEDSVMDSIKNNRGSYFLNIMMIWLTCATVAMITIPWEAFSQEIALRVNFYRDYLYLALIFELSNFVAQFMLKLWISIRRKSVLKRTEQEISTAVNGMDFSERALVREFVLQRKSELRLPATETTVQSLRETGILRQISIVDDNSTALYTISRQARPYITYRALGISASGMTQEQIDQIMSERPSYAKPEIKMRRVYRSGNFKAA